MLPHNKQRALSVYSLLILFVLLTGCQSAPIADFAPDPIHVIEVDANEAVLADAGSPLIISTDSSVVWLNSSDDTLMKIKVLGFFDDSDALEQCFETRSDCATLRDVLSPGDAASLCFPTPGVYHYSVNGPDQPRRGRIVVREFEG